MNDVLLVAKLSGLVFSITWIWLHTNAVYEYFYWLPCGLIRSYKEFLKQESAPLSTFVGFYRSCFVVRLVTCPSCLMAWLSIVSGVFTDLTLAPVVYMVSLVAYSLIYDKKL